MQGRATGLHPALISQMFGLVQKAAELDGAMQSQLIGEVACSPRGVRPRVRSWQ